MADATDRALDAAKLTGKDIDLLIPHQANVRIIEAIAERLKLPLDRFFINVDRYGNTSAAAVAIALDERDGVPRLAERRDVQMSAGALWIAAWLWRLKRSSAA